LRWLNGKRTSGEGWDAYEALPGKSLPELIDRRQPWSQVRFWLLDLAEEFAAAAKDQSAPGILGLDRVWITADGRAKLLDFPAPGATPVAVETGVGPKEFLGQVAVATLEGRPASANKARPASVKVPLPPHARDILAALQDGLAPEPLADRLKRALAKLGSVSIRRRASAIGWAVALPLAVAVIGIAISAAQPDFLAPLSGAGALGRCLDRLAELKSPRKPVDKANGAKVAENNAEENRARAAFEVYIAGRFREMVTNPATWTTLAGAAIPLGQRAVVERLVASRPAPAESELKWRPRKSSVILTPRAPKRGRTRSSHKS